MGLFRLLGSLPLLLLLRAVHINACHPRALASEHFYLRRAAGVALGTQGYDLPPLRERVGDPAVRVARAAYEALTTLTVAADDKVVPALGAFAYYLVGPYALPHDIRELGLGALQMVVDPAEHVAR